MKRFIRGATALFFLSATTFTATPSAQAQSSLLLDNFENGVGAWTRNDKTRADALASNPDAPATLVDITSTRPNVGLPAELGSNGAALIAFKSAKNSWASLSMRVDGARWAKMGAKTLTFYIDAAGEMQGTDLVLRATRKDASGKNVEEKWTMPIRLNIKNWRKVTIPLSVVKNENGPLLSRLQNVYLLQFVQTGSWDSRFFTVDQLQVEGTGTPLSLETPAPEAASSPTSTRTPSSQTPNPSSDVANVTVDFRKVLGRVPTSANISVGSTLDETGARRFPLLDSASFRNAVKVLSPRMIRLEASALVQMTDSSKPSFDFSRLISAVRVARSLNTEPLIAINNDAAWGLDQNGFAQFAAQAARAATSAQAGSSRFPVRFEVALLAPSILASSLSDDETITLYNRAYAAIKWISSTTPVGGLTLTSTRSSTLSTFLAGARGLDFLSLQFYGSDAEAPSEAQLFTSARQLSSVRAAANALDKSRFRRALLYLTQANMNGARDSNTHAPVDNRLNTLASGAWWLTFMANASNRLTDQVWFNDATNAQWGLLNEDSLAYPAFHALWMWNNYAPRGSSFVSISRSNPNAFVFATNARMAGSKATDAPSHNVLLANLRDENTSLRLNVAGLKKLGVVSIRVLDNARIGMRAPVELPKSTTQKITLKPYAIAVLQFRE